MARVYRGRPDWEDDIAVYSDTPKGGPVVGYVKSAFYGVLAVFGIGAAASAGSGVVEGAKTAGIFVLIGMGVGTVFGLFLAKKGIV